MPRKRKGALPSGSVRDQVFVGTRQDGSRRYESFTGKSRQEAQIMSFAISSAARDGICGIWSMRHNGT